MRWFNTDSHTWWLSYDIWHECGLFGNQPLSGRLQQVQTPMLCYDISLSEWICKRVYATYIFKMHSNKSHRDRARTKLKKPLMKLSLDYYYSCCTISRCLHFNYNMLTLILFRYQSRSRTITWKRWDLWCMTFANRRISTSMMREGRCMNKMIFWWQPQKMIAHYFVLL